jgi:hypothetical protein
VGEPLEDNMKNSDICQSAEKALAVLVNNLFAFKQSTIFILRSARAAEMNVEIESPAHGGLRESYKLLDRFASKMGMTAVEYMESHLFFTQISGLELFFQSCISAVLRTYPQKIGVMQFTLSQIIETDSKDILISQATDVFLNKLMYKRPSEYLDEICKILSISSISLKPFWPAFVEAKARRDLGIHNDWKCNDTYLRKLSEVGLNSSFKLGDSVVPTDGTYFAESTNSLVKIGQAMFNAITETYDEAGGDEQNKGFVGESKGA